MQPLGIVLQWWQRFHCILSPYSVEGWINNLITDLKTVPESQILNSEQAIARGLELRKTTVKF